MGILIYVAHPIAPHGEAETAIGNAKQAGFFRDRLQSANPRHAFIAPYVESIVSGRERDDVPEDRLRSLTRMTMVTSRCDAIALCGPRVSNGMVAELLNCARSLLPNAFFVLRIRELWQCEDIGRNPHGNQLALSSESRRKLRHRIPLFWGARPSQTHDLEVELNEAIERAPGL